MANRPATADQDAWAQPIAGDASEYLGSFEVLDEESYEELGIDPVLPTGAKPGSEEKVLMLAARYAAGLPLWHSDDCYDHGPNRNSQRSDDEELLDYLMLEDSEED